MVIKTQKLWCGYYNIIRDDDAMFLVVKNILGKWKVYSIPEIYRGKIPETFPELFIKEFESFKLAKQFCMKANYVKPKQ